jgi:hypothetical protein
VNLVPLQQLTRFAGSLLAFVAAVAAAADSPIAPAPKPSAPLEFVGSMSIKREQFFMLFDSGTKERSGFLKLGQAWRGFTLRTYESARQQLLVSKDGREFMLTLQEAQVENENPGPPLVRGSFALSEGKVLYSADALIRLPSGAEIFAHKGQMSFDPLKQIISGDITFASPGGGIVIEAEEGIYYVKTGEAMARKARHFVRDGVKAKRK